MKTFTCVFLFSLFFFSSFSSGCTQRSDCQVNGDYNYEDCVNRVCVCLTNQGFTRNAITGECFCNTSIFPGASVQWPEGQTPNVPYCVNLEAATQLSVSQNFGQFCVQQTIQVYKLLLDPYAQAILAGQTNLISGIFDLNVAQCRIDPFGKFAGWLSCPYYFYAFAGKPGIIVTNIYIKSTTWNATDATVAIRVDIEFFGQLNATESGIFRFNTTTGLIRSADLIAHNIEYSSDNLLNNRTAFNLNACTQYFQFCNRTTDPLGYYGSVENCMNFLSGQPYYDANGSYVAVNTIRLTKELGSNILQDYGQVGGSNTPMCRNLHITIAEFLPVPHCSHVGLTGGGVCVDPSYLSTYYVDSF